MGPQNEMKIDIEAFRRDLFQILDDIAAGGVAFYAGFTEMLCVWFDDHWRCPHQLVEDGVLTESEYLILNQFSETFRAAYPKGTRGMEQDLRKLQTDPLWQSVVQAARGAQLALTALNSSLTQSRLMSPLDDPTQ